MNTFKVGDIVKWMKYCFDPNKNKHKVGMVIAVVPPEDIPEKYIPVGLRPAYSFGVCGRLHESYLVLLEGTYKVAWPCVCNLEKV